MIVGLLVFPLILLLSFRSTEELRSMPQTCEEHFEEEPNDYSHSESDSTDSEQENAELARNEQDPEVSSVHVLF